VSHGSGDRAAGCEVMPGTSPRVLAGGLQHVQDGGGAGSFSAILTEAKEAGAQIIVTGCPMCHSNLDMRQRTMNASGLGPHNMPVLYLTELLAWRRGWPRSPWA